MSTATDDPKLKAPSVNPLTLAAPIIDPDREGAGTEDGERSTPKLLPGISPGETEEQLEAEARRYGWAPKEEFRGRGTWMDAKAFVSQGRQSLPIIRANLEKAESKVAKLQSDYGVLLKDAQGAKDLGYKIATQEWTTKFEALKAEKVAALADGDHAGVVEVDEDLAAHKAAKPAAPAKAAPAAATDTVVPPEFKGWFDANPWYQDKKNHLRANVICAQIIQDAQDAGTVPLTGLALFDEVKKVMMEEYPDTFEEPEVRQTTRSSGTRRTPVSNTGVKTYENLPPDAKAACDRYVAKKMCTQAEYVAGYDW